MTPFKVIDCAYREIRGLIINGKKYFHAQDIAASLGYVQSQSKNKHTGWQWTLYKQMPEHFKQSFTPRTGRTEHYYSIEGVLWLEKRVTSKARRLVNREIRADFYDWFYKTFPDEIKQTKANLIWIDEPWIKV